MYSLIKKRFLKSINRLKKVHNRFKTNKLLCYVSHCDVILHLPKVNMMQLFLDKFLRRSSVFVKENTVLCRLLVIKSLNVSGDELLNTVRT